MMSTLARTLAGFLTCILLSSPAAAALYILQGSVEYEDGTSTQPAAETDPVVNPVLDPATLKTLPARTLRVVVKRPGTDGFIASGYTGRDGRYNVAINATPGESLQVFFEANNYAAHVWANMDCGYDRLFGEGDSFTVPAAGTVDISLGLKTFTVNYPPLPGPRVGTCGFSVGGYRPRTTFSGAININNVHLATRQYVDANRDPRETDVVPQLEVEYCNEAWNSYSGDQVVTCFHADNMNLVGANRFDWAYSDRTLIHEFGHHLQNNIAAKDGWVTDPRHRRCEQYNGGTDDRREFVFKEAWPYYMAAWIIRENAAEMEPYSAEFPCVSFEPTDPVDEQAAAGSGVMFIAPEDDRWKHVEGLVEGFLFDLADEQGRDFDGWDTIDGTAFDAHREIFQILDFELDRDGRFSDAPDLEDFYEAWQGRMGDSLTRGWRGMSSILNGNAIRPFESGTNDRPESLAVIGAPGFSTYRPETLSITVDPNTTEPYIVRAWRYTADTGLDTKLALSAFLSNNGDSNVQWRMDHALIDEDFSAASALGRIGPINFDVLATVSGATIAPGWLVSDGWDDTTRRILPNKVNRFGLDQLAASVAAMPRGRYLASIPVNFDITRAIGWTNTVTRTVRYELQILDAPSDDNDGDGWTNYFEINNGACSDPNNPDSDGDGLRDGEESSFPNGTFGPPPLTSACTADSDGDGADDGTEVRYGCGVTDALSTFYVVTRDGDRDGDTLTNEEEVNRGLNPCSSDSDSDAVNDSLDNCPLNDNTDQSDIDDDGAGDACDPDADGDGIPSVIDLDDTDSEAGLPPEIARLEEMFIDVGIHSGFYRRAAPPLPLPFPEPDRGDRRFFSDDGSVGALAVTDAALKDLAVIAAADLNLPADSRFGQSAALVQDLNNDNISDLAIGAPGGSAGEVLLLSGSDGSLIDRFPAPANTAGFGTTLALVSSDMLAVGATGDTTIPGSIHLIDLNTLTQSLLMVAMEPGGEFASSMAALPDGDGDGLADLAVGVPGADHPLFPEGSVYRVSTATANAPSVIAVGDSVGDRFGHSIAVAGDVSGDGFQGLLIGAPFADLVAGAAPQTISAASANGLVDAGQVKLVTLDGEVRWTAHGEFENSQLGTAVTVAASTMGPRPYRFLAGAPGEDRNDLVKAGGVYFIVPETGEVEYVFPGSENNAELGRLLAPGDDANLNTFPAVGMVERRLISNSLQDVTLFLELPESSALLNHDPGGPDIEVAIDIAPGDQSNILHPHHDGGQNAIAGLNDNIEVVVFGADVQNGDPQNFVAAEITPGKLKFGPAGGGIAPGSQPVFNADYDGDGVLDAKFDFLTGDTGIGCSDTDATLTGETVQAATFSGLDFINADCDAQCHQ